MKILISFIVGLVVVGCVEDADKNTPRNTSSSRNTTGQPNEELTLKEKVVGFYVGQSNQNANRLRLVLWENGEVESYRDGKKQFKAKWEINEKRELHVEVKERSEEVLFVFSINPDGSLTGVTAAMGGKREVLPKEDQITFDKIRRDAKGSPPTVKSMLAIIGEPLSEDEENFVGRRKGEDESIDSTGRVYKSHTEVIYRRDHTYSLSTISQHNPNINDGEGVPSEAEAELVREEVGEDVVHGIWRIIGDHVYFLDLVFNNEKNPEDEQKVIEAILNTSKNKLYSFEIPESKSEEGEIFPGLKIKEEPAAKLKHPGMWAYNSPNALESFDLLTAYKYAKESEPIEFEKDR